MACGKGGGLKLSTPALRWLGSPIPQVLDQLGAPEPENITSFSVGPPLQCFLHLSKGFCKLGQQRGDGLLS